MNPRHNWNNSYWTGIHPLFIDHVLQEVLQHLEDFQLAKARLVCRQWNFIGSEMLRSRVTLSFKNIGILRKFIDLARASVPFVKFKLSPEVFQQTNKETLTNFLTTIGPQIEALHIVKDSTSNYNYSTSDSTEPLTINNLRKFIYIDKRTDVDTELISYLLNSSASAIEQLSLSFPRNINQDATFLLPQMKNLKRLKLDLKITDEMLQSITESGVRLRELNLSLRASTFTRESLKTLLKSQASSLQELKLTNLYRRAAISVELPPLNELTLFEIHGCEIPAYNITFPSFTYQKIPGLRKLFLNTWANSEEWEKFLPHKPIQTVSHLSLPMNFEEVSLMRRVSKVFPMLTKLEMYYCRSTLDALVVVFAEMVTLEELTLYQSFLGDIYDATMDDVLTGLSSQECQWILKNQAYQSVDVASMQTVPGLSNLCRLEKFDISSLQYRNTITDVTGYLVFLKMEHLKNLYIGCTQIGDKCLEELLKRYSTNLLVGRRVAQNFDYNILQEICNCVIA